MLHLLVSVLRMLHFLLFVLRLLHLVLLPLRMLHIMLLALSILHILISYRKFSLGGEEFCIGDCILISRQENISESCAKEDCYVARMTDLYEKGDSFSFCFLLCKYTLGFNVN